MGEINEKKYAIASATKERIRTNVSLYYDLQKTRISIGNRIVGLYNEQTGQKPGEKQDKSLDKEMLEIIKRLRKEYQRITDAYIEETNKQSIQKIIDKNIEDEAIYFIKSAQDYNLISVYETLIEQETKLVKYLENQLKGIPIYDNYLKNTRGCGTLMSGVIIAYFDIYEAKYVSSFFKFAGLDTVLNEETGKYEGRSKRHTVMVEYEAKDGTTKEKKSITYNPMLKTKLVHVLADEFIKTQSDWVVPYYDYRNRIIQQNNLLPEKERRKGPHIEAMAKRYMIKMFLKDLFVHWKELEGLEVPISYEEKFLNQKPHHWPALGEFWEAHPDLYADKLEKKKKRDSAKKKKTE